MLLLQVQHVENPSLTTPCTPFVKGKFENILKKYSLWTGSNLESSLHWITLILEGFLKKAGKNKDTQLLDKKPEKSTFRQVFEASTVGIHLVLSMFFGLGIGYLLDKVFGTFPYLSVIFFIMGIIAGFREVFRIAKKAERIADGDNDKKNI